MALTIPNEPGKAYRLDANANFLGLASSFASNTEPTAENRTAYSYWIDTQSSPPLLKQRNAANDGWITKGLVDSEFNGLLRDNVYASLTDRGIVQLSSAIDSDSEDIAATSSAVKTAHGLALRASSENRFVNGAMEVAIQPYTLGNNNSTQRDVDLWHAYHSSDIGLNRVTVKQAPAPEAITGFTHCLRAEVIDDKSTLEDDDFLTIRYHVLGDTISDFRYGESEAKDSTISFWIYSSVASHFNIAMVNAAKTRTLVKGISQSAGEWTQHIVSIPGDTNGTWLDDFRHSLTFHLCLAAGSDYESNQTGWHDGEFYRSGTQTNILFYQDAVILMTGFQFELGGYSGGFAYVPLPVTRLECARFYQNINMWHYSNGVNAFGRIYELPVSMYSVPSIIRTGSTRFTNNEDGSLTGTHSDSNSVIVEYDDVTHSSFKLSVRHSNSNNLAALEYEEAISLDSNITS